MPEDSLDIYIRSLVLEATRLEAREIRVVQGEGKPKICFKVAGDEIPFPHPPKQGFGDLVGRLKQMAGVDELKSGETRRQTAKVSRSRGEIPIEIALTRSNGDITADIHLV